MVGRACSQAPSPQNKACMSEQGVSEREENGQGVGLGYPSQRPSSSETPPPKGFTDFQNSATS